MSDTADIVIIGGGIMGSATAYFLAAATTGRRRIVVLEPDPTYARASTPKASGVVRHQYGVPENILMSLYGSAFFRQAPELLEVDGERAEIGFGARGYVWLVTPEILPAVAAMHEVQLEYGADVTFVPADRLGARLPRYRTDGLAGAFFGGSGAGWLDPWGLLQAFRRKASALGAEYIQDSATGLAHSGRRIAAVSTAGGRRIAAGHVVNCAGAMGAARICAMAGLALPVEPRKRSVFLADCREDVRDFPMTVHPSNGVWFRPEGKSLLCGVAPAADKDPATEDDTVDYGFFDDVVWPTMAALVPAFAALKVSRAYAGHYDFNTLDENAILGTPATLDNFLIATGFSGHGIMQSPAAGRAITELILHGRYQTLDLTRFGYDRIIRNAPLPEPACF